MKKIILIAALCFIGSESMAIGRPHNVFATHQIVNVRLGAKQPFKKVQEKPITQTIDNAKEAIGNTKKVVSVVRWVAGMIGGN
jgi:hypothetical protein